MLAVVSRAVASGRRDSHSRDALARFTTFYADKSHNSHVLFGVVAGFLGLFAFAWFLGGVWRLLRDAERGATIPTVVVVVGGAAYVALGMMFHILSGGLGVTLRFSKGYTVTKGFDPGTAVLWRRSPRGAFLASMLRSRR